MANDATNAKSYDEALNKFKDILQQEKNRFGQQQPDSSSQKDQQPSKAGSNFKLSLSYIESIRSAFSSF